jgi:hypothetical protein
MHNFKKGDRYLNHKGEYCIIKSIYRDIIKLQICGKDARQEPWKRKDFNNHMAFSFWRVPFPKTNRTNVAQHLLEYQLNIIGKTTVDTKKNENWFKEWAISEEEHALLKQYSLKTLKKVFKFNNTKAIETFNWWYSHFGLKLKK